MARTYTYDDFDKALRASGLMGQFSDADLKLAQRNPDAGMAILSYKQDYNNATTDEMRALAHAGAEGVRSSFGEFTGGGSGDGYKVTQMSPGGFEYTEPAPTYKNTYGSQVDDLMAEIMKQEQFSYDPSTDPLYSSYKKTYTREGKRATADTLGEAAAMTGGIPSSYAVTAASQAGNYYASQLADKVPELYEMAYSKYLNDYNAKLDRLQMLQDREQFEYGRYLDELEQYENDKSFNYAQWLDEIESQANERSEAFSRAYAAAELGDYSQLEALGVTPDYALLAQLNGGKDTTTSVPGIDAPGVDETILETLKTTYPNGVVTDSGIWKQLVTQYGEDALKAAGYSFGETSGETSVNNEPSIGAKAIVDDVKAFIRMGQNGDETIKTTDDVKNAIFKKYPQFKGNKFYEDWIDNVVASLNLIPAANADAVAEQMEKSVDKWLSSMMSGDPALNSLEAVRDAVLKEFPEYADSTVNKDMLDELIAEIAKAKYGYTAPATKFPQSPEYTGKRGGMIGKKDIQKVALG